MPKDPGETQRDAQHEKGPADNRSAASARHDSGSPAPPTDSSLNEPSTSCVDGERAIDTRPIAELTLSELIGQWRHAPGPTWRRLRVALASPTAKGPQVWTTPSSVHSQSRGRSQQRNSAIAALASLPNTLRQADTLQLFLYGTAIACALIGSVIVRGTEDVTRADGYSLSIGGPYLWLGFLLWLSAEVVGNWTRLTGYWLGLDRSARLRWAARAMPLVIWLSALHTLTASMTAPREIVTQLALAAVGRFAAGGILWLLIELAYARARRRTTIAENEEPRIFERQPSRLRIAAEISQLRKLLIALAAICSLLVWTNTSGNRIEPPIILLWLISVGLWGFVFAPLRWNLFNWASEQLDSIRRISWREHRALLITLALVMLLGAAFRFNKLDAYPPQMFSDLVEKIQDAYKIHHHDDYRIFLANTGGREPLHFYLLSILASQPNMEFNHYALKLMSAIESFATLPIMFWLGIEVMGKRRRRFGMLFGVLAAALVAVSFWHVVIGRPSISFAPCVTITAPIT